MRRTCGLARLRSGTRRPTGRRFAAAAALLGAAALTGAEPAPPPERLLPDDTLAVVAAPDFPRLRRLWAETPLARLWRDPALKPFRELWLSRCAEQWLKPLERELHLQWADWSGLIEGQLTVAVLQNGWDGQSAASPSWVLLFDTKDRSAQLATNLVAWRARWAEAGKPWRAEKVRDIEFTLLTLSSDTRRLLSGFWPRTVAGGGGGAGGDAGSALELVVGRFGSLFILGSSTRGVEKVVARLGGGAGPALADVAGFEMDRLAWFRHAPLYGWVNTKRLVEVLNKLPSPPPVALDAPQPLGVKQLLAATGLTGLGSLAVGWEVTGDATKLTLAAASPAATRTGLLKLLTPAAKDASPPAFVPADAVKFQRLRLDSQQAWATLEKMAEDVSPVWGRAFKDFIAQANKDGSRTEAGFEVKRDLISNLGDDLIRWQKALRLNLPDAVEDPPSLMLLGSANAEALARALGNLLAALAQAGPPKERDFLGHKVYTIPAPMFGPPDDPQGFRPSLHYAASGGYVGLTTNEPLLEEWLRRGESPPKPLRQTPGLTEAIEAAGGANQGWLLFVDEAAAWRPLFVLLRQDSGMALELSPGGLWAAVLAVVASGPWAGWSDFTRLPEWDAVAKYFHVTVAAGGAHADGLCLRFVVPTPPALRAER